MPKKLHNYHDRVELGKRAYERILQHESSFTGLCDEIYHEDGSVYFRFGGYTYRLWHYSILNNGIWEVLDAVKRSAIYYRDMEEKDKREKEVEAQRIEDEQTHQLTEVMVAHVETNHDYIAYIGLAIMLIGGVVAILAILL